jgi:hypothetical protein
MRSANQLIDTLAACTVCGKEHKARKTVTGYTTWAAKDGHAYRSRMFEMTGWSSTTFIQKLRDLAQS